MGYVTGKMIKELRERKHLTQRQLAEMCQISDKTVSKWETERGLPDIGLIEVLATNLGVSVAELLAGEYAVNSNRSANMNKIKFYVCPICGNVIQSTGEGSYTCCGITLPLLQREDEDERHQIEVELVLYEEGLDQQTLEDAVYYISHADMLIIGGTSLAVYPAAGLIDYYRGHKLVLINKSTTPMDSRADLLIQAGLGEVFGKIE